MVDITDARMHLKLMRDLIEIVPPHPYLVLIPQLNLTIAQMATICRMWRHADGQFARFNGAGMMAIETIEETLARAGQRGKVLQQAPHSGFIRFASGRSTVIMDTGSPQTSAAICGYGTLAFEFAVGQNLLVINPGQTATDSNLHRLLCSTKAHSTLTIDGQDSSNKRKSSCKITNVEIDQQRAASGQKPHMMAMNHRMASCITVIYFWQRAAAIYAALIFWTTPARLAKYPALPWSDFTFILG